jgi:hypothetical protein
LLETSTQYNDAIPTGYAPATSLVSRVDELQRGRDLLERAWKINLSFYKGKQYVFYNKRTRRIESLATEDGDKPRYRVRIVANQISPNSIGLLARLTKSKPQFFATPTSAGYENQKATQVAENLLDHWWSKFSLSEKREEAMLWSIICGNGFWKISWDDKVGSSVKVMVDPINGNPIIDPLVERLFRDNMDSMNVDPSQFETEVFEGDIRVDVMSPFNVFLDDSAQVFEDCQYAFCSHPMGVEEVYNRFGIRLKANAVNRYPDESLPGAYSFSSGQTKENVREIFYGYFVPSPSMPEGRVVAFTKGPDIILYDAPWPYPFNELPLVKFPGLRIPGQLWDTSVVEQAVPLQKELNRTLSQLIEYKNLTLKPQMLAPVGSLRQRMTDEPGAIFEYNPVAGKVPEAIPIPGLPGYVTQHLADMGQRLKEIFGLTELMQGQVPPNVEAGVAIDLLQEAATDRLAPQILMMEKALERCGNLMLNLAQKYYTEPRLMMLSGGAGSKPRVEQFEHADVLSGLQIKVEAGSGLPRTRAGKQARVFQMLNMGLISPTKAYKYLDLADFDNLQAQFQADEDQAMREHDKLIDGMVINVSAARDAEAQMMNQMQNPEFDPETGEPMQMDPNMLQQSMDAGLQPLPFENKATHLETHGAYMKSQEFELLPPDVQGRFYKHFELTQQALAAESNPPIEAPRVSLQLRGAVGPTVGSKMLNQAGVENVTPEELLEPPLDTVVIDNKDKPNAGDETAMDQSKIQQDLLNKIMEQDMMNSQKQRFATLEEARKVGF